MGDIGVSTPEGPSPRSSRARVEDILRRPASRAGPDVIGAEVKELVDTQDHQAEFTLERAYSNAKIRFQSFFMLMTTQLCFFAWS